MHVAHAIVVAGLTALLAGCHRDAPSQAAIDASSTEPSPEVVTAAEPTASASAADAPVRRGLRAGDIVFQTSRSAQSAAVQAATRSPLSHMGLVLPLGSELAVLEAVGPVKYTPVPEWIARGVDGRVVVRRPRAPLSEQDVSRLARAAERYLGRPYDAAFAWSDERLYCSEIVWKVYRDALGVELGAPSRMRDLDLSSPVVAAKLRERYGLAVPLDEPVISPQAIADAPALVPVPP